jgi:hypothetical protein
MPKDLPSADYVLQIRYEGDVARFYAGGKLVSDNFYNGSPFDVALWRIPADQQASLQIDILPPARILNVIALPRNRCSVLLEEGAQ